MKSLGKEHTYMKLYMTGHVQAETHQEGCGQVLI